VTDPRLQWAVGGGGSVWARGGRGLLSWETAKPHEARAGAAHAAATKVLVPAGTSRTLPHSFYY
jgi:hypothetical protein